MLEDYDRLDHQRLNNLLDAIENAIDNMQYGVKIKRVGTTEEVSQLPVIEITYVLGQLPVSTTEEPNASSSDI